MLVVVGVLALVGVTSMLLEAGVRLSENSLVHVRVGFDFVLGLVVLRSVVMVFVVVAMALVSSLISVACMLLETSVGLSKDSLMHMGMAVDSVLGLVVLSSVVFIVVAMALMSSLISVTSVLLEAGVRLSEDSLVHVRVRIDFVHGLVVLRSVIMVFAVAAMMAI